MKFTSGSCDFLFIGRGCSSGHGSLRIWDRNPSVLLSRERAALLAGGSIYDQLLLALSASIGQMITISPLTLRVLVGRIGWLLRGSHPQISANVEDWPC